MPLIYTREFQNTRVIHFMDQPYRISIGDQDVFAGQIFGHTVNLVPIYKTI